MSLNLDPRQRAMLQEMGIHVWQPDAPLAEHPPALEIIAACADAASASGRFEANQPVDAALNPPAPPPAARRDAPPPVRSAPRPASVAVHHASAPADASDSAPAAWRLGEPQPLYADTAQTGGARWLVLAEAPATALAGPVFQGDAGRLLDNMLRAARLDRAGLALFAPLVRQGAGAVTPDFLAALAALLARVQPDVVLLMGRLAALALLPTGEPFGKLRGHAHALHGTTTLVTYDAAYLLRTPADKAKAWNDLCLAMRLAAPAPAL